MHMSDVERSGQAYSLGNVAPMAQVIRVTKSEHRSNHYSALDGIAPEEWNEIFDRVGEPWDIDEDEYLLDWYGRDEIVSLSYALGRTPWTVVRRYNQLTKREKQPLPVRKMRILSITVYRQTDFLSRLFGEGGDRNGQ